jgi:Flp pilus assembly protein TadB
VDAIDKLFAGAVGLWLLLAIAWWAFIAYVVYRVITHFGIL